MSNRKKATEYILKWVGELDKADEHNVSILKKELESMSDKEFEAMMLSFKERPEEESHLQKTVPYFSPNLEKSNITLENNFKVAEQIGHQFFERLWMYDAEADMEFLTEHSHLVVDMPCRRFAQLQSKKASIPDDDHVVDDLSGQVTGDSKGSKLSFPELQANASQKLDNGILEFIKIRGGDEVAYREFNRLMIEQGEASLEELLSLNTTVKSTSTVSDLLRGMMLGTNLDR